MSVLFKIVAKGQPGVVGGGESKYYATIVRRESVTLDTFATELADRSTLTRTDIYAVLESFMEKFPTYLIEGRSIYLGSLGIFSPSISSQGEIDPTDVDQYTIQKLKVNFRPSVKMKKLLRFAEFKRAANGSNGSKIVE
ncbi:MAG: HU family DNA-binding protein [Candidatus Cyclobacteriaceae bacterium M2_1C_046]